jgi:hypothetical protein
LGEAVTQAEQSDVIEKNYTHGQVNFVLIVNRTNRQATLKAVVQGEIAATATVQEGRPVDKIVSDRLPGGTLTLRLEAHAVRVTGRLQDGSVDHEVTLP